MLLYCLRMYTRMHERLIVWREAYDLCLWMYTVTKQFPTEERYGLVSQTRRSAMSIPMNIAEGNAKKSLKEKDHYMEIAAASLEELHVQIQLAFDLHYINDSEYKKS